MQHKMRIQFQKLNFDFEQVLLILFLCTLPLKNSINTLSILLLTLYAIFKQSSSSTSRFVTYAPLLVYFSISCLSLIYTNDIDTGLETLLGHSLFLVFPFIYSRINFSYQKINRAFSIFILWICALVAYSELRTVLDIFESNQSFSVLFRKDYSYKNLAQIIGIHPPYMALYTSLSILLLINKLSKDTRHNLYYCILIFLLLFYTIHLSSRLPIIALAFVSTLFTFKKLSNIYSKSKSRIYLSLVGLVLVTLLFSVRSTRYRFIELIGMKYSSGLYIQSGPAKLHQWTSAIDANTNFLFGNGIGDANTSITESNVKHGLMKYANRKYNAHNQYIQTYVGLGILGLLTLLWIIFSSWQKSPNSIKINNYLIVYISIVFLSESYFQRHHGIAFITFIFCYLIHEKRLETC